jgi:hypothetical protein
MAWQTSGSAGSSTVGGHSSCGGASLTTKTSRFAAFVLPAASSTS